MRRRGEGWWLSAVGRGVVARNGGVRDAGARRKLKGWWRAAMGQEVVAHDGGAWGGGEMGLASGGFGGRRVSVLCGIELVGWIREL